MTLQLLVENIKCGGCRNSITNALLKTKDVTEVRSKKVIIVERIRDKYTWPKLAGQASHLD